MSYKTEGNPSSNLPRKDVLFLTLKSWYNHHKRDLPWRHTQDPYLIWLSEIILQQTRVAQGLPYYQKFTERFPTIQDFAVGTEDEILRLWQGLGYYSRARNMIQTAQQVMHDFEGRFPRQFDSLKKLKGVGDYTAAAIASFSSKEPVPVVDGNVYRFLSRLIGIETDIGSSRAKVEFTHIASALISKEEPDVFNQAIMEFGALQCVPINPDCSVCPFQETCHANRYELQSVLPVKLKKTKIKSRFLNYLILHQDSSIAMQKRGEKDVWAGLYEFILVETIAPITDWDDLLDKSPVKILPTQATLHPSSNVVTHQLSHQKLFIQFWPLNVDKDFQLPENLKYQFYNHQEAEDLPKPIVLANYLKKDFF